MNEEIKKHSLVIKGVRVTTVQREKRWEDNVLPLFLPVHIPPALLSGSSQSAAAGASRCSN